MDAEEQAGGRGGEGEVRGEGVTAVTHGIGDGADDDHAERKQDKRAAEETHGGGGEIEEVAEGEVVAGGTLGEQGGDVGAGSR